MVISELKTEKREPNIFVKDLRTNQTLRQYKAPFIPLEGTKEWGFRKNKHCLFDDLLCISSCYRHHTLLKGASIPQK
jgi:hypothetical protein